MAISCMSRALSRAVATCALLSAGPVLALGLTVNSTADTTDAVAGDGTCGSGLPNSCTLRAAIQEANANADTSNSITFSVAGPTNVLTALPAISKALTIDGGAGYTIDGGGIAGLLRYTGAAGAYALKDLTLSGGLTASAQGGGAVYFAPVGVASLTLTDVELSGNEASAGPGGGLAAELLVNGSTVVMNRVDVNTNVASGDGGGLWLRLGGTGSMSLDDSSVDGNTAGDGGTGNGGGINVRRGRLVIGNSSINGNSAADDGAGIYLEREDASNGGSVRIDNGTISGNAGDGIAVEDTNPAASWMTFTTVTANTTGIRAATPATNFPGNVSNPFTSNIVGNNTTNCTVAFAHADTANSGYNLTNGPSCGFAQASDTVVALAADLKLAALASNPTAPQTHALLAGSPAIDAGNPGWSTGADERGADEQDGGADGTPGDGTAIRDIGAYEYGGYGLVQFTLGNFDVDEDNGPALVLIKRYGTGSAATTGPTVSYATSPGTATQGTCNTTNDYTAVAGPITTNPMNFAFSGTAGPTQFDQTASMTICNNVGEGADAAGETFNISLADPAGGDTVGYDFGPNQTGTVTIGDVENGTFQFNPLTYSAAEGNPGSDGSVVLTITRTGGAAGAVRVSYASSSTCTTACTATAGTDYTAVNTFVDFADGEASKTVTVNFVGDTAYENGAGETFEVTLSGVSCQGLAGGQTCDARLTPTTANRTARATITNDDTAVPGTLRLAAVTYTALEADGVLTVTVKRVGGSDGAVGVTYGSTDGTATAGVLQDFFLDPVNPHTLSWANGDTADKTFDVTLVDDVSIESNKAFTLSLIGPTGGATVDPSFDEAAVTLISDEQPAFEFTDPTVSANEGSPAALQLTWDAFEGGPVQIGYYTQDGTAVSPTDYTGIPQGSPTVLTINPADPTTLNLATIMTAADAAAEGNETFGVVLNAPTGGATLGANTPATVTIVDPAGVRFTNASFTRADEQNAQTITVSVVRTGDVSKALSVDFAISQSCLVAPCATEGTDYTRAGGFSGTLSWAGTDANASESATQTFTITVLADTLIEGDEGIRLTLSNAVSPGIGAAQIGGTNPATAVIPDDDYRFEIVDTSPLAAGESGGNATIQVRRFGSTIGAASVSYATAAGTATAGTDYTETASPPALSWSAGEGGIKTIQVPLTTDTLDEADEDFTLTLSSPSNNAIGEATSVAGSPLTVQITDDDAVTVSFSAATQTVAETVGTVTVTATRTGSTTFDVTVPFTVSGTAANPADHNAANGSITILAGNASGTTTFTVVNDAVDETDETAILTMGTPTGGSVTAAAPTTHTVTITDNDAVTVSFSAAAQTVAESVGTVTVTATRTGSTAFDITVPFTVSGTAANPADHNAANGSITILAGNASGTTTFTVVNDAVDETDETVILTMGTPTGGSVTAAAPTTHTVTITDNDAVTVSFSAAAQSVAEDAGLVTVTATRTGATTFTITVPYTVSGTAANPADHNAANGTITILAGNASGTATFSVVDESRNDGDETVIFTMGTPSGGTVTAAAPTTHTVTITDNDRGGGGGGGAFPGSGLLALLGLAALRRRRAGR